MKAFSLQVKKNVANLAVAVLSAGVGAYAYASPAFTVNPDGLEPTFGSTFQATSLSGNSSELLVLNPLDNTATGSGWVEFTAFNLNGAAVDSSGLGITNQFAIDNGLNQAMTYGVYLTFNLKDTLATGTLGAVGSTYTLNYLNIELWYDKNKDNIYTQASANASQAASIANVTDDVKLGISSLVAGTAGINDSSNGAIGAFLNSLQTFQLTDDGKLIFVSPNPFYELAFSGFNNSGGGVELNGPLLSVSNAVGSVDFLKVPEPAGVALVGIGLLGLGATRRRSI